jgi:pimeloyl-ACP methyl ester carboxylesterase
VKVLDFGLAKAAETSGSGSDAVTASPAASISIPGAIMGTAGYLSPEQARGAPVDQRTDIFAFGCVLFEMLTGKAAFGRASVIESISAAIHDEPDLDRLPPETPELVRLLLQRCLAKSPRDRLHHASDVRILLESAEKAGPPVDRSEASHPGLELRAFPIGSDLCRQFDRSSFDPRLIGHEMQYTDNGARSDVLIVFLHSIGQDHRRWSEVLQALPYRALAPTQIGFEPEVKVRLRLPLRDHVILHRAFVRRMQEQLAPSITVLVGFSSGADIAMRVVADPGEAPHVDGLIAMEANTSCRTHDVSSHFARLDPENEAALLKKLGELSATAETVARWTVLHNYLVSMVGKMQHHLEIVRDFARELIAQFPFEDSGPFIAWYRAASSRVRELRCVVCQSGEYHKDIQALRLEHLDSNCLGDHYRDETIVVEPGITHRDLMEPARVLRYVEEVVARLKRSP